MFARFDALYTRKKTDHQEVLLFFSSDESRRGTMLTSVSFAVWKMTAGNLEDCRANRYASAQSTQEPLR